MAWSISGAIERVIDPDAVREDSDDAEYAEWKRRSELEIAVYDALGISTEPADGGLVSHGASMAALQAAA